MEADDDTSFGFAEISLAALDFLGKEGIDALPYGVIGLTNTSIVDVYNAVESRLAGLPREKVVDNHFFLAIAPCMNNFLVAQRFEDEPELDSIIDYVLTLRMRPTPVKMRLLKNAADQRRYILIQR
jgi:photoactive yellow protein